MGRQCGLMKGKGGSMHLSDVDKGVMGSYAIIGAHLTIANGTALASKYNKTKEVSVCFFGDGTTNICLLYTSPSPRDGLLSRMPSSA